MGEHHPDTQPMRGHRRTQQILEGIDEGLIEVGFMIETSIGHAVLHEAMTAQEGLEAMEAYEHTFGLPKHPFDVV